MRNFWIKGSNNRPILCDLRIAKKKLYLRLLFSLMDSKDLKIGELSMK